MITGELKSKVDKIWDTMWSGGISNPISVVEQLTYLLFIKRLDELHTLKGTLQAELDARQEAGRQEEALADFRRVMAVQTAVLGAEVRGLAIVAPPATRDSRCTPMPSPSPAGHDSL